MSILSRTRELAIKAEARDPDAIIELIEWANSWGEGVDIKTETSINSIMWAVIGRLLQHSLDNPKQIALAYNFTQKRGRPKSKRIEQRDKRIAREVIEHMDRGDTLRDAKDKVAGIVRDIRTVERAYEEYAFEVRIKKLIEKRFGEKK